MAFSSHCIYTFHPGKRGKEHTSHFVQSGVHPTQGNRKFSFALSNSGFQFVHAFRRKHASTSGLSCDSASLRLQLPASSGRRTEKTIKDTRNESLDEID